jgi:hypothetical protein
MRAIIACMNLKENFKREIDPRRDIERFAETTDKMLYSDWKAMPKYLAGRFIKHTIRGGIAGLMIGGLSHLLDWGDKMTLFDYANLVSTMDFVQYGLRAAYSTGNPAD